MKKIFFTKVVIIVLFFSQLTNLDFFGLNKAIASSGLTSLKNPLTYNGGSLNTRYIFARYLKIFLATTVFISLIMFLWAGFQYMTADGKGEKTKQAQQTMVWAVLGIAVSFSAYTIINTIFGYIIF